MRRHPGRKSEGGEGFKDGSNGRRVIEGGGGSGWRASRVRHDGGLKLTQSEAGRDEERQGRRGARRKLGGGERCSHS